LVEYKEEVYQKIVEDYKAFSSKLEVHDIQFVPISALLGDNVVNRSEKMEWYLGCHTCFTCSKRFTSKAITTILTAAFPVQYVLRPQTREHQDFPGLRRSGWPAEYLGWAKKY
jgi:sulfate adenylyltransferase subunit 1